MIRTRCISPAPQGDGTKIVGVWSSAMLRTPVLAGLALSLGQLLGCSASRVVREVREPPAQFPASEAPDPLSLNLVGAADAPACPIIKVAADFPDLGDLKRLHPTGNGSLVAFDRAAAAFRIYQKSPTAPEIIQTNTFPFSLRDARMVVLPGTKEDQPDVQILTLETLDGHENTPTEIHLNWFTLGKEGISRIGRVELTERLTTGGGSATLEGLRIGPTEAVIGLSQPGEFRVMHLTLSDNGVDLKLLPLGQLRTPRALTLSAVGFSNNHPIAIVKEQLREGEVRLWGLAAKGPFGDAPMILMEGAVRDTLLLKPEPSDAGSELEPPRLIASLKQNPKRALMPTFSQTAVGGVFGLSLWSSGAMGSSNPLPGRATESATQTPLVPSLQWARLSRPPFTQIFAHPAGDTTGERTERTRPTLLGWLQQPTGIDLGSESWRADASVAKPTFIQRLVTIGNQPGQESESSQPCRASYFEEIMYWPSVGYIGLNESSEGAKIIVIRPGS